VLSEFFAVLRGIGTACFGSALDSKESGIAHRLSCRTSPDECA
jgi:hypothetical protein